MHKASRKILGREAVHMHMFKDIDFQINSDSVGWAGSMGTLFISLTVVSTP